MVGKAPPRWVRCGLGWGLPGLRTRWSCRTWVGTRTMALSIQMEPGWPDWDSGQKDVRPCQLVLRPPSLAGLMGRNKSILGEPGSTGQRAPILPAWVGSPALLSPCSHCSFFHSNMLPTQDAWGSVSFPSSLTPVGRQGFLPRSSQEMSQPQDSSPDWSHGDRGKSLW